MKSTLFLRLAVSISSCLAQEPSSERSANDGPFVPDAAMPSGKVLPLYSPESPLLNQRRVHEAEQYNYHGQVSPTEDDAEHS